MRLIIVHFHLRPGGVRRVIELAAPHLAAALRPRVTEVKLLAGEAPEDSWLGSFRRLLSGTPVVCTVDPVLGYLSEQRGGAGEAACKIRECLARILAGPGAADCLVWAHNLGLGRNLPLARELTRVCARQGLRLIVHHHDWWFENRWARWSEMRRAGFLSLKTAAASVFASSPGLRHAAINQADARLLRRHLGSQAAWLPNLTEPGQLPSPRRTRFAGAWLRARIGADAPLWLLPCRALRRKNIAEALLLTRWLRPEAWLVTTAGVSSADEQAYADRLVGAACQQGWPLLLGALRGAPEGAPSVAECLAASEVVLLTSVQEGFGLPFLEAAAARRPLIARALPNIAPDLALFGLRFPQSYDDVAVSTALFDWQAERRRQERLYRHWLASLPSACRRWAAKPCLLACRSAPASAPFSRLTLTAQLEVLAWPPAQSWDLCAPLNPFLPRWRRRAAAGRLGVSEWPRRAGRWLSGRAYAERFARLAFGRTNASRLPRLKANPAVALQNAFIRDRLQPDHLFPLLWNSCT